MDCQICAEKLNRSSRKPIACCKCEYIACSMCWKTYLTSSLDDPHCMSCNFTWSYETVISMFDKTFINKRYKKHREEMLISREMSLMPATQPLVERQIVIRKNNIIIDGHLDRIRELEAQINVIRSTIYDLGPSRYDLYDEIEISTGESKREFVRKCTYEGCLGYLSTQWKCGICGNWSCPHCYEVTGETKDDHECNEDILASANLIKKDTKLCPKCSMGIFKISGCDVMFCTDCHTSFNWKTNRIITGAAHNPHHAEWLLTRPAILNTHQILCGREVDGNFRRMFRQTAIARGISSSMWEERIRCIEHINVIEIPRYNINIITSNQQLRINLMMGDITEEKFKLTIHKREKAFNKKQAIYNILTMFSSCQTDIIYRLLNAMNDEELYSEVGEESDSLLEYVNELFVNLSKTYNNKVMIIDYYFRINGDNSNPDDIRDIPHRW